MSFILSDLLLLKISMLLYFTVSSFHVHGDYPNADMVPNIHVRVDSLTGLPVTRGRLLLLGNNDTRYSLEQYRTLLQCTDLEPEFNHGIGGTYALGKYIPMTNVTMKVYAAHMESLCKIGLNCFEKVKEYENGGYPKEPENGVEGFSVVRLYRVVDGEIFYDWPWGIERKMFVDSPTSGYFVEKDVFWLSSVVRSISDLPNTVFFFGGEQNIGSDHNIPIPIFTYSPKYITSSAIPKPWKEVYKFELQRFKERKFLPLVDSIDKIETKNKNTTKDYSTWNDRIDKAAFFGFNGNYDVKSTNPMLARRVIFELSNFYPEHIDAAWTGCAFMSG